MTWLREVLTWDWISILKTMVGAGFGTVISNGILTLHRDRKQRKALAAYTAMRLAIILESYTYACQALVSHNANPPHHPDQEFPDWDSKLSTLGSYPEDPEGWRAIDQKLAGRALGLQNKIHASQGLVDSTIEYAPDDLGDEIIEQGAERGLEAWRLAKALRKKYGLEAAELVWDFATTLEGALQKAKKSKHERLEEQAKFNARWLANHLGASSKAE